MEAADRDFVRGIRYLAAARRCEAWSGDDRTESVFRRLAVSYRAHANALMMGLADAAGVEAAPALCEDDRLRKDAGWEGRRLEW